MLGNNLAIKILALTIISLVIGLSIGYVITVNTVTTEKDQDDNNSEKESSIILNKEESEEYAWDPGHHTLISENAKLSGRVIMIEKFVEDERDQYHFLVLPDLQFASMVNDANINDLHGAIMVEIANNDVGILPRLFIGQHLEIQGPHVTDDNHGWTEIDPVRVIVEL